MLPTKQSKVETLFVSQNVKIVTMDSAKSLEYVSVMTGLLRMMTMSVYSTVQFLVLMVNVTWMAHVNVIEDLNWVRTEIFVDQFVPSNVEIIRLALLLKRALVVEGIRWQKMDVYLFANQNVGLREDVFNRTFVNVFRETLNLKMVYAKQIVISEFFYYICSVFVLIVSVSLTL